MKNLLKKILTGALVASAAVIVSVGTVFAADITDVIQKGIEAKQTTIDLTGQAVTPQVAMDSFHNFLMDNPQYYYVDTNVNCSFSGTTAKALSVKYKDSSDYDKMMKVADAIAAEASKLNTDYDKAKYVHDYLANNADYDYSLTKFTARDILVGKSGVCQAYASAYKLIMNKLGIECSYAQSKAMQHMWNVVKINNKWYNVDCAWSNTTKLEGQNATEGYFLKSNNYFITIGYFDWKVTNSAVCSDLTYDDKI